MEVSEVRAYIDRWKAVERVERADVQSASIEDRWQQLNALFGLAHTLGIVTETADDEELVWQRWATLRRLA